MSTLHLDYAGRVGPFISSAYEGPWTLHSECKPAGTPMNVVVQGWEAICRPVMPFGVSWPAYAWPGGYEIHYITKDLGVLCHGCANDHLARTLDADDAQFYVIDSDTNYECGNTFCDHCGRQIEPAYGAHDEDD